MSLTALNGNATEKLLENAVVLQRVCRHFGLDTRDARLKVEYPRRKKTDVVLQPWSLKFQVKRVKNIDRDRGHHVDRRSVESFGSPLKEIFEGIWSTGGVGGQEDKAALQSQLDSVSPMVLSEMVDRLIMGSDAAFRPDYFIVNETESKEADAIGRLYVVSSDVLLAELKKGVAAGGPSLKRTCIHLGPNLYWQRRGGDAKDRRPDDVQTKLVFKSNLRPLLTALASAAPDTSALTLSELENVGSRPLAVSEIRTIQEC